ncbi:MAG: hypothetical protein ACXAC8_06750 [Candidatus Hodarchaeales archaeon]|jgi:hypothetical protein
MQVEPNWALFVENKEVSWSFGNPDEEFLTFVINFLTALSQIGEELFGQHGIAQINFDIPKHASFLSSEIFVVSLMNKFFLIMSDPAVTMKLIDAHGGISMGVQEIMRAVLVGQAAMLYSQSITDMDAEGAREIERIWQNIVLDISEEYTESLNKIVGGDSCNFSMLPFPHLIFLHYYLRKQPELSRPLSSKGWALISHLSGGEIPLDFHVDGDHDPVVVAGYLAIIISFLMALFNSKPKSLVFGTNNIQSLFFINGEDYFIAIDSPFTEILLVPEFHERFFNIEEHVISDLIEPLQKQIIEEILFEQTQELETKNFQTLLDDYVLTPTRRSSSKLRPLRRSFIDRVFGRL